MELIYSRYTSLLMNGDPIYLNVIVFIRYGLIRFEQSRNCSSGARESKHLICAKVMWSHSAWVGVKGV